jgi:hypothetical protein
MSKRGHIAAGDVWQSTEEIAEKNAAMITARQQLAECADDCGAGITCGHCGGFSSFGAWTVARVSGALPCGVFQCPRCGCAVYRKNDGRLLIVDSVL